MRDFLIDRLSGTWVEPFARRVYRRLVGKPESILDRRNREYDRLTATIIGRVMRPDSNSADAGAHRGYFLNQLIRASPNGRHLAFEPIPDLAAYLTQRFPGAEVHAVALGDVDGVASFRYLPGKPAQSSLQKREERERGGSVVELSVPVRRFDALWPIDTPLTFLKVDVEGAELAMLRGAQDTLLRWKPTVVFECDPTLLPQAIDLLEAAGLVACSLNDILNGRKQSRPELERWATENGEWFFAAADPDSAIFNGVRSEGLLP